MTHSFFITAIGTGVGKTFLTCALAHQLHVAGHSVRAIKPVISGFDAQQPESSDTAELLHAQGLPITPQNIQAISPWRFAAPLSPHMAAAEEARSIDAKALVQWCQSQQQSGQTLLLEGVGGIMVPLTPRYLVADWMQALGWPVVLVASNYLGAINHTLLSLEALQHRGLTVKAVVVSEAEGEAVSLPDTVQTIASFVPQGVLVHTLKRHAHTDRGWKEAPDLLHILS